MLQSPSGLFSFPFDDSSQIKHWLSLYSAFTINPTTLNLDAPSHSISKARILAGLPALSGISGINLTLRHWHAPRRSVERVPFFTG